MSSEDSKSASSGGIGFCGLLTIVFITLKLTKYIAWSWWWVLSPLWLPISAVIVIVGIALVIGAIVDRGKFKRY